MIRTEWIDPKDIRAYGLRIGSPFRRIAACGCEVAGICPVVVVGPEGGRSSGVAELGRFPHPALALSFVTQMHLHRSAWDAELLTKLLTEAGFADARAAEFGQGADTRLVRDDRDKAFESLYVDARKPAA